MNQSTSPITLSVIVPLFNEENNIKHLIERLEKILTSLSDSYEIVLVNDGSKDTTWKNIQSLANDKKYIKGISFVRNFGHQHALLAGLMHAQGKAIVSMDGDLQHPPELIPKMVNAWKNGYKVVSTYREDMQTASFFKRTTSKWFYKIFSFVTDVPISSGTSDFRLLDRSVVENLITFNDVDLFLRGAINWLGYPTTVIPFKAEKRFTGKTKYNLKKMMKFAIGAIVSFSTKPLKIGVIIGLITSVLAFIEIIYIFIQHFRGMTVQGWASTVSILSFLFGILFIILGIIGTYLARIHEALQYRPRFILEDTVNINDFTDNGP